MYVFQVPDPSFKCRLHLRLEKSKKSPKEDMKTERDLLKASVEMVRMMQSVAFYATVNTQSIFARPRTALMQIVRDIFKVHVQPEGSGWFQHFVLLYSYCGRDELPAACNLVCQEGTAISNNINI